MNSKHLAKGSSCPPLQTGKVRIYNMRFCPYAQRAVLVALAKEIPHDIVNCNLVEKPEWLLKKNANGKVPTVELSDGRILYESLIVAEYLDEMSENRPLSSLDNVQKALDKIWVEEFNKPIALFYKVISGVRSKEEPAKLKTHFDDFLKALKPFEDELNKRGTQFFGGRVMPGMLDYMIWPWIERLPTVASFATVEKFDFKLTTAGCPKLENWREAMKNDLAVKSFLVSPEIHTRFMESYLSGSPNYDILS